MDVKVVLDWRSFVALGFVVFTGILAVRMPEEAVEGAFDHVVDAFKSLAMADSSSC